MDGQSPMTYKISESCRWFSVTPQHKNNCCGVFPSAYSIILLTALYEACGIAIVYIYQVNGLRDLYEIFFLR
jgi:hypothetical protein